MFRILAQDLREAQPESAVGRVGRSGRRLSARANAALYTTTPTPTRTRGGAAINDRTAAIGADNASPHPSGTAIGTGKPAPRQPRAASVSIVTSASTRPAAAPTAPARDTRTAAAAAATAVRMA